MSTHKAYLMTQEQYLKEVVPVLKDYKTFLKKNNYFIPASYGGMVWVSYPDLMQAIADKKNVGDIFTFSKEVRQYETPHKEYVDIYWGRYMKNLPEKEVSADIAEKNREFQQKLEGFFDSRFVKSGLGDADNMKSNKRAIRYAIEYDIYKNLLADGNVELKDLERYAESAGVKIPKRLIDSKVAEREDYYKQVYANMPAVNKAVLTKLVEELKESFRPLEAIIYAQELKRFTELVHFYLEKPEVKEAFIAKDIPFYEKAFTFDRQRRYEVVTKRGGKDYVNYLSFLALKNDWGKAADGYVKNYVESLKAELIFTINEKFNKITLPLKSFDKKHLALGKGNFAFDSLYKFNFENGSSFDLKTQAIGAGGYNIQVYHFRYISDFLDAKLTDGTVLKNPSLSQIIEHFSDKASLEKLTNPYLQVEAATTPDEIVEALYKWAKNNHKFTNVRKNSGKEDASLSYKPYGSMRYGSDGLYFKRPLPLETLKEKAVKFLDEYKAPKPTTFEQGGQMPGEPKRLSLPVVNKAINAKYPGVYLVKGNGYFYIQSDDEDMSLKISGLYNNNIPVNSLNQQPLEQYLRDVEEFMKEIDENEEGKELLKDAYKPRFNFKKEDGGPVEDEPKLTGYAKRISENMKHMGSKLEEWRAVPIIGMDKTTNAKGDIIEIPIFDFPKGYKHAEGIFPSQSNAPYNCELCGKRPINTVYWIQNDEKHETLGVGSECVKFIGEGVTGKDNLRQTKVNMAIMLDKDLSNLASVVYRSYARKKSGQTRADWGESFIGEELPDVYAKMQAIKHDLLFGKNQRNKDYIYWQKVWDSIPVFSYENELLLAEKNGEKPEDVEKKLLSWYSRNEKNAVPLMEQVIAVMEALEAPLIEEYHSDYLESKNKAAEPMTFKKGGTIDNNMKADNTPAGGYLKGKEGGATIVHNEGNKGGLLVGRRHSEGGIKAINKSNGQPIEVESGEAQIVAAAVNDPAPKEFDGKKMSNKQILSTINEQGGGVAFAARGMHIDDGAGKPLVMNGGEVIITRNAVSSNDKHEFEGEMLTNKQILSRINQSAGGVAFEDGGEVPIRVKVSGKKYKYNGSEHPDYEIAHTCGCMHKEHGGPVSKDSFIKGYRIESKEHYDTFRKLRAGKITEPEAVTEVVNEHLAENSKYYEKYAGGGNLKKEKPRGIITSLDIPAEVKEFMPLMQQKAIVSMKTDEYWDVLDNLETIIAEMPVTYQTSKIPLEDKVLWLHYFYGGSDWYIVEKDKEFDQLQAFGYVVLNGDTENAEWGYISIEELKATNKVELDFHFTPTKFKDLFGEDEEVIASVDDATGTESVFPVGSLDWYRELPPYLDEYGIEQAIKKSPRITKKRINDLKEVRLSDIDIRAAFWGYPIVDPGMKAEGEFTEDVSGILRMHENSTVDEYIDYIVKIIRNGYYEAGFKYAHFPKWKEIFTKYGISTQAEELVVVGTYEGNKFEHQNAVWKGNGFLASRALGAKIYKGKKDVQINSFKSLDGAEFQNDYCGIICRDLSLLKSLLKDLLSDPESYAKDMEYLYNGLGGVMAKNVIENNIEIPPVHTSYIVEEKAIPAEELVNGKIPMSKVNFLFGETDNERTYYNYDDANAGLKELIATKRYGNIQYQLIFSDGEDVSGVIDAEPYSFWQGKDQPFTWHINYFWNNVAYHPNRNGLYSDKDAAEARVLVEKYDLGTFTKGYQQPVSPGIYNKDKVAILAEANEATSAPVIVESTVSAVVSHPEPMELVVPAAPVPESKKVITLAFNGKTQAQINNEVRELTDKYGTDRSKYSADDLALLKLYEGSGGLAKHGETGARLFDQFFTPNDIVAKMWGLALKYGFNFNGSNILEPSVGSGRFLQFIPKDANVNVVGYDVDITSYTICKVLFPQYDIRHGSFESMFFQGRRHVGLAGVERFFDLVITNPPYRDYISEYAPLGEKAATGASTFESYFIMRGVDVLKPGGLLIMLIPNTFMSNDNKYNAFKEKLAQKADLIDAYRLPNDIFNNTSVGTDIIVLKKK